MLLGLLLPSIAFGADIGIENLDVKGYVSLFAYQSSSNQFDEQHSDRGSWKKSSVGALLSYRITDNISAKLFTTSLEPIDYGFIQYKLPDNYVLDGIRVGRVNRLSGVFGGFGVQADKMNFLPQSTSPNRIGRTFFRFDGIQLFKTWSYGESMVHLEYTAGNPIIDDSGGVFDPTFYAVFDAKNTEVTSDLVHVVNFNYFYRGFQFFADYITTHIDFDTVYKANVSADFLESLLGLPANTIPEGQYPISESVSVTDYKIYTVKTGVAQAFGDIELIATYFLQVGVMSPETDFSIGQNSLGNRFSPEAFTIMSRILTNDNDILYFGITQFKSDFDNTTIASAGVDAPDWVDYGQGAFIGYSYLFKKTYPQINTVGEFQHNRGGSYLSATYQDPLTSRRVWNVLSASLNMYW